MMPRTLDVRGVVTLPSGHRVSRAAVSIYFLLRELADPSRVLVAVGQLPMPDDPDLRPVIMQINTELHLLDLDAAAALRQ